ncbi:Mediator of RNA polymerase II transcription subunit 31 [Neophaeococcomyces mojaviensis]|uniref:Mediator of RNA polymerase II transcription subunit 31 n=1 Tax=Neophaeococcomyces mojaviensis TaxID=3383035 RepID=A0ACC3AF14_9EURO|nr:Mediator of RNA polymerase II transcription subunit 31 [Knufia sp. JES_112]
MAQDTPSQPPQTLSPRFTLELEFVLSLSNPAYLQWLGVNYPHLFNPSENNRTKSKTSNKTSKSSKPASDDNSDAAKFARYLAYLYSYWKTPQYSQFLTHPAATLRNLELLQQERFRQDIVRPDFADLLAEGFTGFDKYEAEPAVNEDQADGQQADGGNDQTGEAGENGVQGT